MDADTKLQGDNNPKAVFIRHKCDSTVKVLRTMWDRGLIALHYEDSESTNPEDYGTPAARKALKRLSGYCKDGAIVGACFREIESSRILVGRIRPGSVIRAEEFTDSEAKRRFVYKVVELEDAKKVSYADFPLLKGIQPRQATITGWQSAANVLKAALDGKPIPRKPSNLHPSQLEVLCYEWLRDRNYLEHLVLPIGRSLIDIDILGVNKDGQRVLAQVTHAKDKEKLEDKRKRLAEHIKENDHAYFFLPEKAGLSAVANIKQVTLERVFEEIQSDDPAVRAMLDFMFGGEDRSEA